MKKLLIVAVCLTLFSCLSRVGSHYEVTTPDGYSAKAWSTSDTTEVMFRMIKDEGFTSVELYKIGTDNTAAIESLKDTTDFLKSAVQSAVPVMLRGVL